MLARLKVGALLVMVAAIQPQPGPQTAFLSSPADIAIYGGSAGSGKSFAMALEPLRHAHVPGFSAVFFRRLSTQLTGSGSIWEECRALYPQRGGKSREHPSLEYRFRSGALVELRHLQYEKDVESHHSKQYTLILFDELTQFTEYQFWYMLSRNRSTCGVRPYIRAGTNPDPESFVAKLIAWWIDQETGYPIPERSGVVRWFVRINEQLVWGDSAAELVAKHPDSMPLSLTFVAAKLADNKILEEKDPTYRAKLMAMPLVERERLLHGNWRIRPAAGLYFRPGDFTILERVPDGVMGAVRSWDLAATPPSPANPDPAWTRGVRMSRTKDGLYVVEHVAGIRVGPGGVERLLQRTATQDGYGVSVTVPKDPGQAGKSQTFQLSKTLEGFTVTAMPTIKDKVTRAGPWSSCAENGHAAIVRGEWNAEFLAEHEAFPDSKFKDQVDAAADAYAYLSRRAQGAVRPVGVYAQPGRYRP